MYESFYCQKRVCGAFSCIFSTYTFVAPFYGGQSKERACKKQRHANLLFSQQMNNTNYLKCIWGKEWSINKQPISRIPTTKSSPHNKGQTLSLKGIGVNKWGKENCFLFK